MLEKTDKISIITVCLNAINTIEATISSVCSQKYNNIEFIVVDGSSVDGTSEMLDKYQQQNKLQYISESDKGIYDAMNKGINLATGEWIFFLGSDDIFYDEEVCTRIFSKKFKNEEIIYGNVKLLHAANIYDGPFDHEKISVRNICQQSVFYRRSVFEKIGQFNLKYKVYADHEFNIRWIGAGIPALYVDETIAIYNEKGISGKIVDDVFLRDWDDLLINNNIVSSRSFGILKKRHLMLLNSYKYKIGKAVIDPVVWFKSKFL